LIFLFGYIFFGLELDTAFASIYRPIYDSAKAVKIATKLRGIAISVAGLSLWIVNASMATLPNVPAGMPKKPKAILSNGRELFVFRLSTK